MDGVLAKDTTTAITCFVDTLVLCMIQDGGMASNRSVASASKKCGPRLRTSEGCSSEANRVIHRFNALSVSQKQDILNFLRSL